MELIHSLLLVPVAVAISALILSVTSRRRLARRLGKTALWLSLAVVPAVFVIDLAATWSDDNTSGATVLGRAISHALNLGTAMLPAAFIASFAIRRTG